MATTPLRKAYEEGLADLRLQVEVMAAKVDSKSDRRTGTLVEYDATSKMFSAPSDERTENYITGRFG